MLSLMQSLYDGGTQMEFRSSVQALINSQLTDAWHEAARDNFLSPDELTTQENQILNQEVLDAQSYIAGISSELAEAKESGKEFAVFEYRADLWASNYDRVYERGRLLFGADTKQKWVRGQTEESCVSCDFFDGRVYRRSVWDANSVYPKMTGLKCTGRHCDCNLIDTDEPITRGAFPQNWPR